jgi:hypothetical protein
LSFLEDRFEDVVYVEQVHGVEWLEAADEGAAYEETFAALERVALMAGVSVGVIADAAEHLR